MTKKISDWFIVRVRVRVRVIVTSDVLMINYSLCNKLFKVGHICIVSTNTALTFRFS